MTFIITEPCVSLCDTACVKVCPVDCIHGPKNPKGFGQEAKDIPNLQGMQLYIDPKECIDCGACIPECPVEAIFAEKDVPEKWMSYIQKNSDFFSSAEA